jgi:3-oxoacyl-[acyl-carrier protein] reductase
VFFAPHNLSPGQPTLSTIFVAQVESIMKLRYKTALVTGGSKGIGLGIAEALVREGMNVAITGRGQAAIDAALRSLNSIRSDAAIGIPADARDLASQQAAVRQVLGKWEGIDVLIANAGVGNFAPIDQMTAEQWTETIDINLTGVFFSLKACVEALKKSKGYFITISSLAGTNFFAGGAAYNASKFGLTGFTQAAMLDLRPYGIKTTTIMPGSVATHFNAHKPGPSDEWKIQIEDLGQMVVDLLRMHPRTLPSKIEVRPSQPK